MDGHCDRMANKDSTLNSRQQRQPAPTMRPEQEAALIVADALRHDAAAHDAGNVDEVGGSYDDVLSEVLPLWNDAGGTVGAAFKFWDWWIDARSHGWRRPRGIARDDWPRLARHIAAALENGNPVTDPVLLERYAAANRGFW